MAHPVLLLKVFFGIQYSAKVVRSDVPLLVSKGGMAEATALKAMCSIRVYNLG